MTTATSQSKFDAFFTYVATGKTADQRAAAKLAPAAEKKWYDYTAQELGIPAHLMPTWKYGKSETEGVDVAYAEYVDDFDEAKRLEIYYNALNELRAHRDKKYETVNLNGKMVTPKNDREQQLVDIGLSAEAEEKLKNFFLVIFTFGGLIGGAVGGGGPGAVLGLLGGLLLQPTLVFFSWVFLGCTMASIKTGCTSVIGKIFAFIFFGGFNLALYLPAVAFPIWGIIWLFVNLKCAWDSKFAC